MTGPPPAGEVAHAGMRGTIAAMAMTGMRAFTVDMGIVEQTPPESIVKKRARGLIRHVPRKRRRAAIEVVHWGYGALGGAAFRVLPDRVRLTRWAGPAYGFLFWVGFEVAIAPALGLSLATKLRVSERAALAADHLLYGFILTETRPQPRE